MRRIDDEGGAVAGPVALLVIIVEGGEASIGLLEDKASIDAVSAVDMACGSECR